MRLCEKKGMSQIDTFPNSVVNGPYNTQRSSAWLSPPVSESGNAKGGSSKSSDMNCLQAVETSSEFPEFCVFISFTCKTLQNTDGQIPGHCSQFLVSRSQTHVMGSFYEVCHPLAYVVNSDVNNLTEN